MLKKIFHILILNILLLFLEWVWRSFLIIMKLYFESFISHSRLKVCYLHYTYLYMIGSTFAHIQSISLLLRDCCKLVQDGSTLDNLERYGRWNLVKCLLSSWTSISADLKSFSSFRMEALSFGVNLVQGLSALLSYSWQGVTSM